MVRMAALHEEANCAALGWSLVEGALAEHLLTDAAPVGSASADGVLADVALVIGALMDGALQNNADGRRCRARPGGSW